MFELQQNDFSYGKKKKNKKLLLKKYNKNYLNAEKINFK
jgi:hypothetical protein